MNTEQIQKIVKLTIEELIDKKLLYNQPPTYPQMLRELDKKFHAYFHRGKRDDKLHDAIINNLGDPYIEIIFLHYRDKRTMEWIAENMDKDVSTIRRNKKRLIEKIYKSLEG